MTAWSKASEQDRSEAAVNDDIAPYDGEFASSTYVAVLIVGRDGVVRYHTSEAGRMLASPGEDLVGKLLPALFPPEASGDLDVFLRKVGVEGARRDAFLEVTCTVAGRGRQLIRMTGVNMAEGPELVVIVLCQFGDRAGVRQGYEEAHRAARYDGLTGLLNRRAFEERGQAFFGHGGVRPAIIAAWDVDHLKAVNDFHGHRIGDQVLRHVAERLATVLGAIGVVARVGGDEFAVLLPETSAGEARLLLEAAASALRAPLEGTNVAVTATCGATVSMSAQDWPGPWIRADEAVYKAKHSNPGGIQFSDQE